MNKNPPDRDLQMPVGILYYQRQIATLLFMDLFLVRHGAAKPEYDDPRRPLTDDGRAGVEKVACAAAARNIGVVEILHSDKLRAKETAGIIARVLSPARSIREISGLSPEDDPLIAKAEIEAGAEPVMLVGHLPHLSRLVALLLTGDSENTVVDFSPATMVCLTRTRGAWSLSWVLCP
jgi:phosphohistidine phosphatase